MQLKTSSDDGTVESHLFYSHWLVVIPEWLIIINYAINLGKIEELIFFFGGADESFIQFHLLAAIKTAAKSAMMDDDN